MTDQTETATTMWQDQFSGKRGHELMTEKLAATIPTLYANENVADYDTVLAVAKLFSPYSNWTWYITELDPATGTCFGLVEGLERELGYFDLTELAETNILGDVPAVERDLFWEPRTIGEIKRGSPGDSPNGDDAGKGDTMTDVNETEDHAPDVANAEEFLFGGVTEETADDAPADAEGDLPVGGASEEMDADVADEPDAHAEDGAGKPGVADVADASEEQPAPAGKETTEDLKVVLSIRGNRATIGVQRPSADPHIESFDDPDLFGLADEFPAVVARAKARWEDEPMHPAYDKPAPKARRRNRREQAPAAETAIGEGEMEQSQPENLRLF